MAYDDLAVPTLNEIQAMKGGRELEWSDLVGFTMAVRRLAKIR
jgi:hypothetical protein